MEIVMIGAFAGGFSGAAGYFMAEKVHGNEKGTQIYPLYAVCMFGLLILVSKIIFSH